MKITNTNKVSTQARILTSLGDEMKRVGGSLETSSEKEEIKVDSICKNS